MSLRSQTMNQQAPKLDRGKRASEASRGSRPLDSIRFSVVPFRERSSEIMELRRAAYRTAHELENYNEAANLTDPRDQQASMVIAELDGQIIASVRLTLPLPGPILYDDDRLEGDFSALPPTSELLESSWGCIHPDHQGKGLFWHLVAHKLVAAKAFGRPYIVGSTAENIWSKWRSCGYRKIDLTYTGKITGTQYSIMMLDLEAVLAGEGIAPVLARALQELPIQR